MEEDGSFSKSITIPSDAAAGSYQLVAAVADEEVIIDFTLLQDGEVLSAPVETEVVFQRTATEAIVIGLIAVALTVGGTVLVFTEYRKRASLPVR